MKYIAILASGSGTNAENISRYFADSTEIRVAVVLSNNQKAGVHERIRALGIPSFVYTREEFAEGTLVLKKLKEYKVELVVLAGFMNKISEVLLKAFPDRMINIHPSLLPKYGGKSMYGMNVHEAVVAAGEKETGITIHYLNDQYDKGGIIFQASCPVVASDTPEEVAARVHGLEYTFYPQVIKDLLIPNHL